MSDCEVKIAKNEEYVTLLEDRFVDATTKSIRQEGWICALQVQLQLIGGRVEMVKERATMDDVVARVAKEEAAWVVERYNVSTKFEDEVNEAICDAYYKGFEE